MSIENRHVQWRTLTSAHSVQVRPAQLNHHGKVFLLYWDD